MKTYLVTGAAGFIGANYIKYILAKHSDVKVVILDPLPRISTMNAAFLSREIFAAAK